MSDKNREELLRDIIGEEFDDLSPLEINQRLRAIGERHLERQAVEDAAAAAAGGGQIIGENDILNAEYISD